MLWAVALGKLWYLWPKILDMSESNNVFYCKQI